MKKSNTIMTVNYKKIIEEVVARTIVELKAENLVKDQASMRNTYRKTEQLLYAYNSIQKAIEERRNQVDDIRQHGLAEKSKSIVLMPVGGGGEKMDGEERIEEFIKSIEKSISISVRYLALVDHALSMIEDDQYYDLLIMKYFDGRTQEEIAEHFGVDVSTVSRNKSRLINELKIYLFSDEAIFELFV